MARKPGTPSLLYSVWRNSDDRLIILDGTAEQCAKMLGIELATFRKWSSNDGKYNSAYKITRISTEEAKREEEA